MKEKPIFIIKREEPIPHYELHYNKYVEFVTLNDKKIGKSKVHIINTKVKNKW